MIKLIFDIRIARRLHSVFWQNLRDWTVSARSEERFIVLQW